MKTNVILTTLSEVEGEEGPLRSFKRNKCARFLPEMLSPYRIEGMR
jgi:hypothetical protein